tara:strand:- start:2608 stop:3636 length:1029 start_codon:yes stop_codon:yes gene_type:complete
MNKTTLESKWQLKDAIALYQQPFQDLIFKAQTTHRQNFNPNEIQASTLVNIQQGGCPEDCKWCSQSIHNDTKIKLYPLMKKTEVLTKAKLAKQRGASRICLGAAWRNPSRTQLATVSDMVKDIKALGLETCVTLGQLTIEQAKTLKSNGLDYYNHNLESSPEHFAKMTTTRKYEDRLKTLQNAQQADLKLCSGGIVGMGETRDDQIALLVNLANLSPQPQSVPINQLIPIPGTPMAHDTDPVDEISYVRLIAIARIMMPKAYIRLSAGREALSETTQTLAFLAGANSFFLGEKLLTTNNRDFEQDQLLLSKLGMQFDSPGIVQDRPISTMTNITTEVCVHDH